MTRPVGSTDQVAPSPLLPQRRRQVLLAAIPLVLAAVAASWLIYQFWRLTLSPLPGLGAVDLRLRWNAVSRFFAGMDTYGNSLDAVYPPASYLILAPLSLFDDVVLLRFSFGAFSLAVLIGLVALVVRRSGEASPRERWLMVLVVLAAYPVGATIGNGQTGLLVVLCLLAGLPLLERRERPLGGDLWIALLVLIALVKPTMSAFFFWIVLFAAGSLRPSLLVGCGYVLMTLVASFLHGTGPIALVRSWLGNAMLGSKYGARRGEGAIRLPEITGVKHVHITSINLHSVLSYLRQVDLMLPATLTVLGLLGLWVFIYRRCPIWVLIGVTALVVRFGMYHGWYDDVVLVLPLVTLFRIAKGEGEAGPRLRWFAVILLSLMSVSLLAPGGIYWFPYPWNNVSVVLQTVTWLGVLVFLLIVAHRCRDGRVIRLAGR